MKDTCKFEKAVLILGAVCLLVLVPASFTDGGQLQISASRAQTSTAVIPRGPNFPIALNLGQGGVGGKPGIAFDGANFIVTYTKGADVFAHLVTPKANILISQTINISVGFNELAAAASAGFDGTNFVVIWCAKRGAWVELYAARVTPLGTVLDPGGVQITNGGNPQIRPPGLAFDGTNYLVAWRNGLDHIYATRVSKSLANLDAPAGFPLTTAYTSKYPTVAFDGANFLVVWHDDRNSSVSDWDIYGARVTPQGVVLDPGGFVICEEPLTQEHTSVGFDGTNFLVAWGDRRPNNDEIFGSVYAARVSPTGAVLDTPAIQITDKARGPGSAKVVCGGSGCLVIWNTDYPNNGQDFRASDVWGRRISPAGAILDQQGIPIATAFGHQFAPIAGYGGGRYLVVWNESTGREMVGAIYGQILAQQSVSQASSADPKASARAVPYLGGAGWNAESAPVINYAGTGIAFSADNSYAFGETGMLRNKSGTWKYEPTNLGYLYGSWASAPDDIWITGWLWGFDHYDGQEWLEFPIWLIPSADNIWGIATGVWGSSPTHLWATGDGGHLFKYDGVSNWTAQDSGLPYDLADIWGTSGSNIYAVGERGTVFRYNGIGWNHQTGIPTLQKLNAIWGSGASDIFAVGDWGTILHFDGTIWSVMDSGTLEHLYDVWGVSGSEVFAVGFGGTILHYNGTSWMEESSGTTMDLLGVWGVVSDCQLTVWASGSGQQILKHEQPLICTYLPFVYR